MTSTCANACRTQLLATTVERPRPIVHCSGVVHVRHRIDGAAPAQCMRCCVLYFGTRPTHPRAGVTGTTCTTPHQASKRRRCGNMHPHVAVHYGAATRPTPAMLRPPLTTHTASFPPVLWGEGGAHTQTRSGTLCASLPYTALTRAIGSTVS